MFGVLAIGITMVLDGGADDGDGWRIIIVVGRPVWIYGVSGCGCVFPGESLAAAQSRPI